MRKAVITQLLVVLLIATVGCGSGNGGAAVDMMKKVPRGVETFGFLDMAVLRTDNDFQDLYDDMEDSLGEVLEYMGIRLHEVDCLVSVGEAWKLVVLKGDFDLNELRDELEDIGFDNEEYRRVEVWELEGSSIALMSSSLVVIGIDDEVEDCIRVVEDGNASLYDDNDFKDVIDRLPSGILISCQEGPVLDDDEYDGLEVAGFSAMKKDEYTMAATMIFKFDDAKAAEGAVKDIENDLEEDEEDWRKIRVTRDDEFVKVTAETDIEDFVSDTSGSGSEEDRKTEKSSVQLAVGMMLSDNGLSMTPNVTYPDSGATATNDMALFPDSTSVCEGDKLLDPDGNAYVAATDDDGYILFDHDITGGTAGDNINYLPSGTTDYYYTIDSNGTVHQYSDAFKTTEY